MIYSDGSVSGGGDTPLQPLEDWQPITPMPPQGVARRAGFSPKYTNGSPGQSTARKRTSPQYRAAMRATAWSILATALFSMFVIWPLRGHRGLIDFWTGFLVEKSLSVDNLFVFLMLFNYFKVPEYHTQRVLKWGILSALVLRGGMIAIGVAAVKKFRVALLGFAAILVFSSIKMLKGEDDDDDLSENGIMRFAKRIVGATDHYDGDKFFTTVNGKRVATPMLVVLVCIELSDVVFAVDSIPAVVGITQDPLVVYSSNIFALLALRSLYLLLSKSVQQLHYLRHSVALILGFVGVKLMLEFFHYGISSFTSLAVIATLLALGTAASLARLRNQRADAATAALQGGVVDDRHGV